MARPVENPELDALRERLARIDWAAEYDRWIAAKLESISAKVDVYFEAQYMEWLRYCTWLARTSRRQQSDELRAYIEGLRQQGTLTPRTYTIDFLTTNMVNGTPNHAAILRSGGPWIQYVEHGVPAVRRNPGWDP